jgi:D-alanyl-D-alanine dipeptidase/carboxypeptidase
MKTIVLPRKAVHTGALILVNAQFPFEESAQELFLVPVNGRDKQVLLERGAVRLLSGLMEKVDGWHSITPVSGWRSLQAQATIYAQSLRDSGEEFTRKFVALPGHSEHQTGLAIDLGLTKPEIDSICPDFPDFGVCREFRRWAAAFGFIERYPAGREAVTGIAHEPWHFRYVGIPHAAIMARRHFTLEEYHGFLRRYPHGETPLAYREGRMRMEISYAEAARAGDTHLQVEDDFVYSVSGNNADGFVVTTWRERINRNGVAG